jgi:long-chain acyl-CoA synthetase
MDRRWREHYDPGVPHTLAPYPRRTLLDLLADVAGPDPGRPLVEFKGTWLGYREVDRLSDAFAAALAGLGVRKGDRLALLLPNCPQFLVAELGAWKAGAVVVPLNPLYTADELARPLIETEAETAVVLTPFYGRVKSVQPRTALRRVVATGIKEHLPPLLRLLFTLFKERRLGHRIDLAAGDAWLAELIGAHAGAPRPAVSVGPDDPAVILMSGGTTGTPKGVVGRHGDLVTTGVQGRVWCRGVMGDGGETLLLPLPLFHAAGGVLGLSVMLASGNAVSLVPNPRDQDDLLRTIRRVRPTFFAGVPALFASLLGHPRIAGRRIDLRSIKLCFCGAAPLLAETKRRFEELTGGRICEVYSLTEALVAMVGNPVRGVNKIGSVGMPAPDVDLRIVDTVDGRRDLPAGEVGEVLLRAPQVMTGYWRAPEETALALRDHGDGGGPWLHTGDLGYLDEDGYLFLVDRMKDLMKPGGMQVWPREVEEVVAAHPAVAEVGVAAVRDSRGEAVKAWVVLRPGTAATADEIRAWCKERLAPFKVPSQVEFRSDLPKSLVGKVLCRALAAEPPPAAGA